MDSSRRVPFADNKNKTIIFKLNQEFLLFKSDVYKICVHYNLPIWGFCSKEINKSINKIREKILKIENIHNANSLLLMNAITFYWNNMWQQILIYVKRNYGVNSSTYLCFVQRCFPIYKICECCLLKNLKTIFPPNLPPRNKPITKKLENIRAVSTAAPLVFPFKSQNCNNKRNETPKEDQPDNLNFKKHQSTSVLQSREEIKSLHLFYTENRAYIPFKPIGNMDVDDKTRNTLNIAQQQKQQRQHWQTQQYQQM